MVCLITSAYCSQVTSAASFAEDLGLDSLDAVEVVMAVEEVRHEAIRIPRAT